MHGEQEPWLMIIFDYAPFTVGVETTGNEKVNAYQLRNLMRPCYVYTVIFFVEGNYYDRVMLMLFDFY